MTRSQHQPGARIESVMTGNADGAGGESAFQARQREQQLADSCQGLVRTLAWQVHRRLPAHVEIDDLIAYGQVGLAQAAKNFNPAHGASFTTFAFRRIRGAILDGLSQMAWFSRHEYHARRYEQMANELMNMVPDDLPPDTVEGTTRWLGGLSSSLAVVYLASSDESSEGTQAGDGGAGRIEIADDRGCGPQQDVIGSELRQRLRELIDALPSDAGTLIRLTYFEGKSLQAAADELRISRSWASRLHQKTLDRLAQAMRALGVDDPF